MNQSPSLNTRAVKPYTCIFKIYFYAGNPDLNNMSAIESSFESENIIQLPYPLGRSANL